MIISLSKYGEFLFSKAHDYEETVELNSNLNSWFAIKYIDKLEFNIHFYERIFYNKRAQIIEIDWEKIEDALLKLDGKLASYIDESRIELEKVHDTIFQTSLKVKKGYFLPNAIKLCTKNSFDILPNFKALNYEFCFSLEHLKYPNQLMDPYQMYYARFDSEGNFISGKRD